MTGSALALATPIQALTSTEAPNGALRLLTDAGPAPRPGPPPKVELRGEVVPVSAVEPDPPPAFDLEGLIKATGLADLARRTATEQAAPQETTECSVSPRGVGLARVMPWVAAAAQFLSCHYDQPRLIGVAARGRHSDHPSGHALDVMVRGARGDRIAECVLRNRRALGVSYVIWKQRINYGDGWHLMADRGNETENHYDHVHISFTRTPPTGAPSAALCR